MSLTILSRRSLMALTPAALLAACATETTVPPVTSGTPARPPAQEAPVNPGTPSGRVELRQTQVSYIGNVAWGSGTLTFQRRRHAFRIRGLGVGGIGASRMTAVGDVYGLRNLADFAGVYGQLRAGVVAGGTEVRGGIWMQNEAGVRINLRPRREGLALQLGGDGMHIELQ